MSFSVAVESSDFLFIPAFTPSFTRKLPVAELDTSSTNMWFVTVLALGATASPGGLEAAAGFEAVASKLAGKPSKQPDVVKSRLKLIKLRCTVLTHSRDVGCTRTRCTYNARNQPPAAPNA